MTERAAEADAGWVQGILLSLAPCMLVMSVSATLPIIPAMLHAFAGQPGAEVLVPMLVVVPMLSLALTGPLAGALGEKIGRRRLLDYSTLVFAVSAVMPFWLTNVVWVLASRAVMGVALGGMITSAVGLTGDYFTGAARQRWLAIQGAAGALSAVIASAASGALAEISWRLPFLMLASGFPFFVALLILRGPRTAAAAAAEAEGPTAGTERPAPVAALVAIFALGVIASFLLWPPAYALGVLLEEKALGSAMMTGVSTSVLAAGAVVGAMGLGVIKRLSPAAKQALAFAVAGAGAVLVWAATSLPVMMLGAFLVGVGEGVTAPVLSDWLLEDTPLRIRGRVVGMFQTTFFLAQFASPLLAQAVAKASGGTTISMLYYGVACGVLVLVVTGLRVRRRAPVPTPAV